MASILASQGIPPAATAICGRKPDRLNDASTSRLLASSSSPLLQRQSRSTSAASHASALSSLSSLAPRQLHSRSSPISSQRGSSGLPILACAVPDDNSSLRSSKPASSASATRRDLLASTVAVSAALIAHTLPPALASAEEAAGVTVAGEKLVPADASLQAPPALSAPEAASETAAEATGPGTAAPASPASPAGSASPAAAGNAGPITSSPPSTPNNSTTPASSSSSPITPTQQPAAQQSPAQQPAAQQSRSRPASEVLNVASWQRVRGEDFAVRLPPGFVDVTPQPDEEALNAPMSTLGLENRATKSPLLARFVSQDEAEVITVVYRRAAEVKLSFLEPKDVADFGPIEDVANLFVPPGSRVLAKRAFTASPRRVTRTYYLYEFVTGKGPKALHGAMSVSVARGQVYLMAATAPEDKWRPAAGRLRAAAGAFQLVI